jgi:transcriptional regulator GlxA family with amidase domain
LLHYLLGLNAILPTFYAMTRRIVFLIYPGFQILDAAGPIAAFEIAARYSPMSYDLRVSAAEPGLVMSSSGVSISSGRLGRAAAVDTLVVAGGDGATAAAQCPKLRSFVRACARHARRTTSVCSGAYVLAAAGLLDGKSATTHWSCTLDFSQRFPRVHLETDRIFVKSGQTWTSAGITAGIDLSLALIEEDLGESIARQTAQQLVVYYRRPGGQSQFSALLRMEQANGRFSSLLDHVRSNLCERHSVETLAAYACMSARNFSRAFQAETGMSPAKAVERLRAETARGVLAGKGRSIKSVAQSCGFGSAERMRRSFLRVFGMSPAAMKF